MIVQYTITQLLTDVSWHTLKQSPWLWILYSYYGNHTSAILFWMGVPVSSSLLRQLKLNNIFHLWLQWHYCTINSNIIPWAIVHNIWWPAILYVYTNSCTKELEYRPCTTLNSLSLIQDHILPFCTLEIFEVSYNLQLSMLPWDTVIPN